jgi:hypothetical protein
MAQRIQKLVAVGGVGGGVGPFDQLVAELSGNGTEAIVLVGEVSGPESNGDATPRRRATGLRRLRGGRSADRAGGAATDRRRTRAADKAPVADEDSALPRAERPCFKRDADVLQVDTSAHVEGW